MNQIRTFMLMAAMMALFMGIGLLIGGYGGMMLALLIGLGTNIFAYWNSDKLVLRMHNAQEAGADHPLTQIVAELVQRANMPMPKVYLVNQPQPNAFATGRNPQHAAVAATTGLLQLLDRDEIAAVMAHELGHIKNRDTLLMTMTATLAGAISMLGSMALFGRGNGRSNPLMLILAMVVAPMAAAIVQMAISRTREYGADAMGAEISGQPMKLASALAKLQNGTRRIPNPVAERNPAAASLYIMNQATGGVRDNLFSTHPAAENRIAALQAMSSPMRSAPISSKPRPVSALGLERGATTRQRKPENPWK